MTILILLWLLCAAGACWFVVKVNEQVTLGEAIICVVLGPVVLAFTALAYSLDALDFVIWRKP